MGPKAVVMDRIERVLYIMLTRIVKNQYLKFHQILLNTAEVIAKIWICI